MIWNGLSKKYLDDDSLYEQEIYYIRSGKKVLSSSDGSMSIAEIYAKIIENSLYIFHAQNPLSVLRIEIRRHSIGIDFSTAYRKKYFLYDESNGKFQLLGKKQIQTKEDNKEKISLQNVRNLYYEYVRLFQQKILQQLKAFNPYEFERFCMNLLKVYGFVDLSVNQRSKDGGIDGFGKLKIGLAYMNVAFQCKRWNTSAVGKKEIDAFRGAIQGEYEQGIFFYNIFFY